MTVNGKSDSNGVQYVRLSLNDYLKLISVLLVFFSMFVAASIGVSGIFAHMSDAERHQTEARRRELMREELVPVWQEIRENEERIRSLEKLHQRLP